MNRVSSCLVVAFLGLSLALPAVPAGAFPRTPEELGGEGEGTVLPGVGAFAEPAFVEPPFVVADRPPSPPIPPSILRPSELARLFAEMGEGDGEDEGSPAATGLSVPPATDRPEAEPLPVALDPAPAPPAFFLPSSLPSTEAEDTFVAPRALAQPSTTPPAPQVDAPAPVEASPAALTLAFGREIPTLTCVPTRACSIELAPGELVDGYVVGDPIRWQTAELAQGEGSTLSPVLVVKPAGFNLRTNLLVTTNRRTYHAELVSPAEGQASEAAYEHVRFWYPAELAARRRSATVALAGAEAARAASSPVPEGLDPSRLSWDYRAEAPRSGKRLPWVPRIVFDDGTRTYLHVAPGAAQLPAVFGLLPDGTLVPANAHLAGSWLIVPATFDRLELVTGTGRARRSLRISKDGGR